MMKQTVFRSFLVAFVISLFAAPLGACGRKGSLEAPEGADPHYPRSYPALDKELEEKK